MQKSSLFGDYHGYTRSSSSRALAAEVVRRLGQSVRCNRCQPRHRHDGQAEYDNGGSVGMKFIDHSFALSQVIQ